MVGVSETTVLGVVSGVLALAGIALLWDGARQYRHQRGAVRRAQTASGTIESTGVDRIEDGSQVVYVPRVEYEYLTPTRRRHGDRLYPGASRYTKLFHSESAVEAALAGYEPGASTTVYYDPEAPDHAFLEPSPHRGPTLARMGFGAGLVGLAVVLPVVVGSI
ncbi:DUF3592 domain-containing protein [Halohasta salina]|uniref:DUF3592 domain-containing protein n=1 Tax=Halohasta salina TaxID=2961621 RepID=UPI0020A43309|nr:DUF3592 domain-containing protein [Halohasta salina]